MADKTETDDININNKTMIYISKLAKLAQRLPT